VAAGTLQGMSVKIASSRNLWRGSLIAGKVSIPVTLQVAASHDGVEFKSLHKQHNGKPCLAPIRQTRKCSLDGDVIAAGYDDTVRGFEFAPGQFVTIDNRELEAALGVRELELVEYVPVADLLPVLVDDHYWLVPTDDQAARAAYQLLVAGLLAEKRAAVGRLAMFTKERIVCIRPLVGKGDPLLACQTLYTWSDVRETEHISKPQRQVVVDPAALTLMRKLIKAKAKPLDPKRLERRYPSRIERFLAEKIAGGEIHVTRPKQAAPRDLMAALKASLPRERKTKTAA
jgi:DNA end-binding protein Ku